jgi:hypothetical protein
MNEVRRAGSSLEPRYPHTPDITTHVLLALKPAPCELRNCSSAGANHRKHSRPYIRCTLTIMPSDKAPPSTPVDASASATSRLAQVSAHITPNTPKRRRRKGADSNLPADYSDILGQIATLRKSAAIPDPNNRGYVRQKQAGKLWVRERVEQLLDPGSFQEVGSVSGTVKWRQTGPSKEEPIEYVPSNNVQGELTCWRLEIFADTLRFWTAEGS